MAASSKPRIVGFNHVAVEIGDIDEALAFYGRLFWFELRGKSSSMAFIDLGVYRTSERSQAAGRRRSPLRSCRRRQGSGPQGTRGSRYYPN